MSTRFRMWISLSVCMCVDSKLGACTVRVGDDAAFHYLSFRVSFLIQRKYALFFVFLDLLRNSYGSSKQLVILFFN